MSGGLGPGGGKTIRLERGGPWRARDSPGPGTDSGYQDRVGNAAFAGRRFWLLKILLCTEEFGRVISLEQAVDGNSKVVA